MGIGVGTAILVGAAITAATAVASTVLAPKPPTPKVPKIEPPKIEFPEMPSVEMPSVLKVEDNTGLPSAEEQAANSRRDALRAARAQGARANIKTSALGDTSGAAIKSHTLLGG